MIVRASRNYFSLDWTRDQLKDRLRPESSVARLDLYHLVLTASFYIGQGISPAVRPKEKERRILITLPVYRYTNSGRVGSMTANRMPNGPNRTTPCIAGLTPNQGWGMNLEKNSPWKEKYRLRPVPTSSKIFDHPPLAFLTDRQQSHQ